MLDGLKWPQGLINFNVDMAKGLIYPSWSNKLFRSEGSQELALSLTNHSLLHGQLDKSILKSTNNGDIH